MSTNYNSGIVKNGLVWVYDGANKSKCVSPNHFPYPTDAYSHFSLSTAVRHTQSRDSSTPGIIKGSIPMKMLMTGENDPYTGSYNTINGNIAAASAGETWTLSFYAKASKTLDGASAGGDFIFGATSAGSVLTGGSYYNLFSKNHVFTTEWERYSHTVTFTNNSVEQIQVRFDGPNDGANANDVLWFDGIQLEKNVDNPTPFSKFVYDGTVKNVLGTTASGTANNNPVYNGLGYHTFEANNNPSATSPEINFPYSDTYAFNGTLPWTVESWVRPHLNPGTSNWTGWVDREGTYDGSRNGWNQFVVGSGTNMIFRTERYQSGTIKYVEFTEAESDAIDQWVCVTSTYNNPALAIYKNGVMQDDEQTASGTATNLTKILTIGDRGGYGFSGDVGKISIYNRALSEDEVLSNFNATRNRFGL